MNNEVIIATNNDKALAFEVRMARNIDIENKVPFWDHAPFQNAMEDILAILDDGPYSHELNKSLDRFHISFPNEKITHHDLKDRWVLTEVLFDKEPSCVVVNEPRTSLHLWMELDPSLMGPRDLQGYDIDQIVTDCLEGGFNLTDEVAGSEWTLDGDRLYRPALRWVLLTFTRVGVWSV